MVEIEIKVKNKESKKLYHLKNDFGEYNKIITDEKTDTIRKIFADECMQCAENNILTSACVREYSTIDKIKRAIDESGDNVIYWLNEATKGLFNYDIDTIIEKLNNEHNWLIEVYTKEI